MKTDSLSRITLHVLRTLPDSLSARRELLEDVTSLLPRGHDNRVHATHQLRLLRMMDQEQREFCFTEPRPSRDGQHNGGKQ